MVRHHGDKFGNLKGKARTDKVKELLSGLEKQQTIFSHSMKVSDATVKASCLIAKEIAVKSKEFSDEEFAENCSLKARDIVFPEKRQCSHNNKRS